MNICKNCGKTCNGDFCDELCRYGYSVTAYHDLQKERPKL